MLHQDITLIVAFRCRRSVPQCHSIRVAIATCTLHKAPIEVVTIRFFYFHTCFRYLHVAAIELRVIPHTLQQRIGIGIGIVLIAYVYGSIVSYCAFSE